MSKRLTAHQWSVLQTMYPEDMEFVHTFIIHDNGTVIRNTNNTLQEIVQWCNEMFQEPFYIEKADKAKRGFNPYVRIHILNREDAFLFKLTWHMPDFKK